MFKGVRVFALLTVLIAEATSAMRTVNSANTRTPLNINAPSLRCEDGRTSQKPEGTDAQDIGTKAELLCHSSRMLAPADRRIDDSRDGAQDCEIVRRAEVNRRSV